MDNLKMIVLGGGGHSKVVISCIESNNVLVNHIYDDSLALGSNVLGVPVIGSLQDLKNKNEAANAIIAIGNNSIRKKISEEFDFLDWKTFVHPTAYVHHTVKLGKGVVVMAGAIIQPETVIGDHVIINTGAIIDHDCKIESFVHIAPGCKLAGGVKVSEGSFLGIGTSVIPKIEIGYWSRIGASSVVVKDIPDSVLAYGVPAQLKGKNE